MLTSGYNGDIIAYKVVINLSKIMAKKLNITLREDLLERIDEYAEGNGMTRSGLLAIAATQYLNAVEAMPSVNKLLKSMAAVSEGVLKGEMSPRDAQAKLDAIQATYEELSKRP